VLTRWTVENFKPICGPVTLELTGITAFAGLNSSGKSSVLQSILLLSQTLANQILDRALILNGGLVRLGTFDSVHNDQTEDGFIKIGFELSNARSLSREQGRFNNSSVYRYRGLVDSLKGIKVAATFSRCRQTRSGRGNRRS